MRVRRTRWFILGGAFLAYVLAALALLVLTHKPVRAKTKWPTSAELQRCEPWPKHDAKLRAWCEYWSKRLP